MKTQKAGNWLLHVTECTGWSNMLKYVNISVCCIHYSIKNKYGWIRTYVHIHCSSEKTTPYICQIPTKPSVEYIFLIILVLILAKARYVALKYSVCRMQKVEPFDCYCSHASVTGVAVSLLVSGLTVDILCSFCDGFMVQFVKFMLIIFEFGV